MEHEDRHLTPQMCETAMEQADAAGLPEVSRVIDMLATAVGYFTTVTPARARANVVITTIAQEMRAILDAVYDVSGPDVQHRIAIDFMRWDAALRAATEAMNLAEAAAAENGDVTLTTTEAPAPMRRDLH